MRHIRIVRRVIGAFEQKQVPAFSHRVEGEKGGGGGGGHQAALNRPEEEVAVNTIKL